MYKIAFCDDELKLAKLNAKMLNSEIIEKDFNAEITIITDSQEIIYDAILKEEIDILILDIDFGSNRKNGLDFASELRKINKKFYLIFLTAHPRFVDVSFLSKTFDYLTKPIHKDVFSRLVDRLIEEFSVDNPLYVNINRSLTIKASSILYIEKFVNSCTIVTTSAKYSATITLDKLLEKLPDNFARCHRSYIINKNKISSIDKRKNLVVLDDNITCHISDNFDLERRK